VKTRWIAPATLILILIAMGCARNESSRSMESGTTMETSETYSKTNALSDRLRGRTVADLSREGRPFRAKIELPGIERSIAEMETAVRRSMIEANRRLDELAMQEPRTATFDSTIAALDDILYPVVNTTNRMFLIKETSTNEEMRTAAADLIKQLSEYFVDVQYRVDVYEACNAFAEAYRAGSRPRLRGEDQKLFDDTMRDYRRAGLHLDDATRQQVAALQVELSKLSTDFDTNITNAEVVLTYTKDELEGVPASQLERMERQGDQYLVKATVTPQFMAVMQNARSEESRRRMKEARYSVAMDVNGPILDEIVRLREEIADLLGYDTWADYKTEPKMAETAARAMAFEWDLIDGLERKFEQEIETFRTMKVAETGDRNAEINIWDWRYYENQLKKDRYDIDAEALRVYFPMEACLDGMFDIYSEIFGLRFEQLSGAPTWAPGVSLWATSDSRTGEPLGLFYLDLFPREGKYNHFAQFGITDGKMLEDGSYQRPVVALICNFTPPAGGKPSLLSHDELETLFHEFGHALHSMLTRAKYVKFSGTSVPRDFVEAPSQMLENWVWDTEVLNTFAGDYRDPSKKIDQDVLDRMEEARLATVATFYRRQLAFGVADLRLHMGGESYTNSKETINAALAEVFLAPPQGTHFAAYWGHLTGYDAGYYGYAWADAIAADMATVFENADEGLMDREAGMLLRNEIYAVGGSRPIEESIRAFLGRERSIEPFLTSLGIQTKR